MKYLWKVSSFKSLSVVHSDLFRSFCIPIQIYILALVVGKVTNTIQHIARFVLMAIYPVDNVIQPSKNCGLKFLLLWQRKASFFELPKRKLE